MADEPSLHLSPVEHSRRQPAGLGVSHRRCCAGGSPLALPAPAWARGRWPERCFFVVTLSPVLGFVDHNHLKWSFVAARFQYLAGIGIMAVVIGAVACSVDRLSSMWQKGAQGITAVVLVILGLLTWPASGGVAGRRKPLATCH